MGDARKRILTVEDEKPASKALVDKLTREGFEVLSARNGEEGLAMALKEHPDLILLDVVMPKMDGVTMLSKLREDSWGKDAEVVLLTNLSDNKRISEVMQQGIYDYLVKTDWKIDDVVAKVRERTGT